MGDDQVKLRYEDPSMRLRERIEIGDLIEEGGFGEVIEATDTNLHRRTALKRLKKKLEKYKESGADYLVTDCPGCVLQLRGGADHEKLDIEVKHISEILVEEIRAIHEKA